MNLFFKKIRNLKKDVQRGMTLVELMIVLAIFLVLTGVIIFDYSSFRSAISTQNLANDIALSIRKAQSYAIGVRGIDSLFGHGHGIYFTTKSGGSNLISGSNKSFIIYYDLNDNGKYDYSASATSCGNPSLGNECEEILSINSSDEISAIYLDGSEIAQATGGMLDIVFKRPNPDAMFCYRTTASGSCPSDGISSIKIEVSNGRTDDKRVERMITVWNTGQISVD